MGVTLTHDLKQVAIVDSQNKCAHSFSNPHRNRMQVLWHFIFVFILVFMFYFCLPFWVGTVFVWRTALGSFRLDLILKLWFVFFLCWNICWNWPFSHDTNMMIQEWKLHWASFQKHHLIKLLNWAPPHSSVRLSLLRVCVYLYTINILKGSEQAGWNAVVPY